MKRSFSVGEVVPQSRTMSLLSEVVDYGDGWIETQVRITPRSLFLEADGVPAWIGIEYMAQTVAAHAGLQERLQGRPPEIGFLVGTRRYRCERSWFSLGETLSIRAENSYSAENGLMVFECEIRSDGVSLASAALNVYQPDDVASYVDGESFGEHRG